MENSIDIQTIMNFLPHRYPFLLIDRVLDMVPDEKVVALKNVTINEPFFQGHFPGSPIMPGVLVIEAMAQAGALLFWNTEDLKTSQFYFMGLDNVRFRKPVVPGDQLIFELRMIKKRGKVVKMSGTASVDGQLVAEAELMAMFGDKQ